MSDVFDQLKRSNVMSRIKSRGNKDTELALIQLFREYKITGWLRNKKLFGKPDFIFPKLKLAVFVDGCFWHFCPKHGTKPKTNSLFWNKKLVANKKRATLVNRTLRSKNWRVIRIWEHELTVKNRKRLIQKMSRNFL